MTIRYNRIIQIKQVNNTYSAERDNSASKLSHKVKLSLKSLVPVTRPISLGAVLLSLCIIVIDDILLCFQMRF